MNYLKESLDILAELYSAAAPAGPHSVVLMGHCLWCAAALRGKNAGRKAKYIVGFLIVLLGGFGGSIVTGLLIQRPDLAPNPVFADWRILSFTLVAWYMFEYTPLGDLLFRIPLVPSFCRYATKIARKTGLDSASYSRIIIGGRNRSCPRLFAATVAPLYDDVHDNHCRPLIRLPGIRASSGFRFLSAELAAYAV